jgi:glycerol-3-phosphate dehydrogenase subunit B
MAEERYDVVVVGGGLTGIVAAAAARQRGARVALVTTGPGTFVLGSGALNAEGMTSESDSELGAPQQGLEEAFAFFTDFALAAGCRYGGNLSTRAYLPTALGTFQPVSMAPCGLLQDPKSSPATALVVGIDGLQEVNARFIADGLTSYAGRMGISTTYGAATIRLPWRHEARLTRWEIANSLDRDQRCWQQLADVLRPIASRAAWLILPGMLGLNTSTYQMAQFEQSVGCPVREFATIPPSVVGWRLFRALDAQLRSRGATILSGFSVVRVSIEAPNNFAISLDTPGKMKSMWADALILATGGPIKNLLSSVGIARFQTRGPSASVVVDANLRLLDDDGRPIENLFIAGRALQNIRPENGNAMAILTGYRSGKRAAWKVDTHAD